MEYLIYGLEKNETRDYMESLLFTGLNESQIEKAKAYAIKQGYHKVRVASFNFEKPDFIKTLNI